MAPPYLETLTRTVWLSFRFAAVRSCRLSRCLNRAACHRCSKWRQLRRWLKGRASHKQAPAPSECAVVTRGLYGVILCTLDFSAALTRPQHLATFGCNQESVRIPGQKFCKRRSGSLFCIIAILTLHHVEMRYSLSLWENRILFR